MQGQIVLFGAESLSVTNAERRPSREGKVENTEVGRISRREASRRAKDMGKAMNRQNVLTAGPQGLETREDGAWG